MNVTSAQNDEAVNEKLQPPSETKLSMVLNGVGNGMMLGAIPTIATHLYADTIGKEVVNIPKPMRYFNAFATVFGVFLGGAYGMREARKLSDYRQTIADEITSIAKQTAHNTATIKRWQDRMQQRDNDNQSQAKSAREIA